MAELFFTPGGPNRATVQALGTIRSVRNFPDLPLVDRRLKSKIELRTS
jgi:hypothetical protein